jgi:hypothetical protein
MAEVLITPGVKYKATASNTYVLGNASDENLVGSFTVHLVDGGSFTGSVVPQARSAAPIAQTGAIPLAPSGGGSTLDAVAFVNTAYFNEATGLYSTSTISSVPALITMRASGLVCALNTTVTTGTLIIYVERVLGASA